MVFGDCARSGICMYARDSAVGLVTAPYERRCGTPGTVQGALTTEPCSSWPCGAIIGGARSGVERIAGDRFRSLWVKAIQVQGGWDISGRSGSGLVGDDQELGEGRNVVLLIVHCQAHGVRAWLRNAPRAEMGLWRWPAASRCSAPIGRKQGKCKVWRQ